MQTATITIDSDTTINGYGIIYAGEYTIECPVDYDTDLITAEDMVLDCSITIIA